MSSSCTICIPIAFDSEYQFLRRNLEEIQRLTHPEIQQEVLVMDQTGGDKVKSLVDSMGPGFIHVYTYRIDAGHPLDVGCKIAIKEFFLSLDVDCVPIHKNWLYAPIMTMIENPEISALGKQTGLQNHYDYAKWCTFCGINNYFRFMRTSVARKVSEDVGFTRPENRYKSNFTPKVDFPFEKNADNGVVANAYMDNPSMGVKVSLSLDKILGMSREQGVFGMTIDGLVWHMVFGGSEEYGMNKEKALGDDYLMWYQRIRSDFSKELLDEIIANLKDHHPIMHNREIFENGKLRQLTPNDKIFTDFSRFKNA